MLMSLDRDRPPDGGNPVFEPAAAGNSQAPIRRTRVSAIWVGLIIAAILLIGLLIFVGQNSRTVTIHYLGLDGRVPLAVALLASAVCGVLLVAVPGTARIIQLRRALKKNPAGCPRRHRPRLAALNGESSSGPADRRPGR